MSTTMDIFFRIIFILLLAGIHGEDQQENNVEPVEEKSQSPVILFGYDHTEEWGKNNPSCWGSRQSPVNLNSYDMARLEVPKPFKWRGYDRIPKNMTFENNGNSVELSGTWEGDKAPRISGGVLEGEYAFAQLHFHWGSRNNVGCEHTINNHSLPLEMHMLHYKKEYGSVTEAQKHEDGLAVVGVLFEIDRTRNRGISELQNYASSIKTPGSNVEIKPFPLSKFKLNFPGEYVTYLGSLTTPPCSEIVTWILPAIPRSLSRGQINFFRSIQLRYGVDHNNRPTMPRNGRMIYYISY